MIDPISVLVVGAPPGDDPAAALARADGLSVETADGDVDAALRRRSVDCLVLPFRGDGTLPSAVQENPSLPVVALIADDEGAARALAAGATDYARWTPGGDVDLVAHRIEAAVDRARADAREDGPTYSEGVVRGAPSAVLTVDASGTILDANPATGRVFGHDPEELVGEPLTTLIPERLRGAHLDAMARYVETSERTVDWDGIELPGLRADGREVPLEIAFHEGEHEGRRLFTGLIRDVSARKEREAELDRERRLTDRLFETAPVALVLWTADGENVSANRRARELLGLREGAHAEVPAEEGGWRVYDERGDPLPPSDYPSARVRATGEPVFDQEIEVERPGGGRVRLSMNAAPIRGPDGGIERVVTAGEDVTAERWYRREVERQRDRLEAELNEALTRVTDAVFALDDEWRFTYVNRTAEELLGAAAAELLDRTIWEAFPDVVDSTFEEEYRRAVETQESVTVEGYFPPLETWFEAKAYPSESGLSIYFRDVGERKRREMELERYEAMANAASDGIYALGGDSRFILVNDAFVAMAGYSRAELIGAEPTLVRPDAITAEVEARHAALDPGEAATIETDLLTADGGAVPVEARFTRLALDGEEPGRVGVVRDIADRKRFEETLTALHRASRELLHAETRAEVCERVLRTAEDVLGIPGVETYLYDEEAETLGPAAVSPYLHEVFGELPVFGPGDDSTFIWRAFVGGETTRLDDAFEAEGIRLTDPPLRSGVWIPLGDHGILGMLSEEAQAFDDDDELLADLLAATAEAALDRVERDERRRARGAQLEVLAEAAGELLAAETARRVSEITVETARIALHFPIAAVALYDEETGLLEPVAGSSGAEAFLGVTDFLRASTGPAWEAFVGDEQRAYAGPLGDDEWYRVVVVPLAGHGVLVLGTTDDEPPADEPSMATILGAETDPVFTRILAANAEFALDRADRERTLVEREGLLEEQNERLDRLNHVNDVIRRTDQALVKAASREAIERAVCENLADSGPYRFAWIGGYDPLDGAITPHEWAGVEKGYLDAVTVTASEEPTGRGPAATAVQTREPQVVEDLLSDDPFAPWREAALKRGYRSSISIPLVYESSLYGVLNVYADRPHQFDELERGVLAELGETVGYAINAVESKRALLGDTVVELEFRVRDRGIVFLELTDEVGCAFEFQDVVPLPDGRLRAFFVVRDADPDAVEAFAAAALPVDDSTLIAERDGECVFEWTLSEPNLLALCLDHGVVPRVLTADRGEGGVVVDLARDADVRGFAKLFEATYPETTLLASRERERPVRTRQSFEAELEARLTDRQAEVLRTAYRSGFFESPRIRSGRDVAATLGIAQPTFNTHLRTSQRKLLSLLYDEGPEHDTDSHR